MLIYSTIEASESAEASMFRKIQTLLLTLNLEAFARSHHETAYQLLALHQRLARQHENLEQLIQGQQIARQQCAWISEHELAAHSVIREYEWLIKQVEADIEILKHKELD
jgi:hypothetical protein